MPIWRLQTSFQLDTAFPRDAVVITPHFNDHGLTTDPQNLCQQLADTIGLWMNPANMCQITVKAYDAQGTPPVVPQGSVIKNVGLTPVTLFPREIALCLSFYADTNVPRRRGRLYIPLALWMVSPAKPGLRPASTDRDKVGDLVQRFAGVGGADVDFCVFSRRDNAAHKVTNWFVDDEWDTVRSRGLRPTTRTQGTTSG